MTNKGKEKYEQIKIPAELDQVIWSSMKRAEREKQRATARKWIAAAAAVFCLCFAGANIAPIYAYASDLPVIGTIVRVLHIGTGGARTDGAHITANKQGEIVDFRFESNTGELDAVPVYTAIQERAPNRLVLTLHGVRTMDAAAILNSLLETDAVQDAYLGILGDDSAYEFVIVLNTGYNYEITEYENPSSLAVHFYPNEADGPEQTVYYLRTAAMPYGEELGLTAEQFYPHHATQLKTKSGEYIVVVGLYATEDEAAAALKTLETEVGGETGLFIASGTADAVPEQ